MPVEFALRPRIRLREDSPRPQRSRVHLPRFALPVALYWLVVGGLTYAFVHQHDARPPLADSTGEEAALAVEPTQREHRAWWQRVPESPSLPPPPANEAPAREADSTAAARAAPAVAGAAPDLPPLESTPEPTPEPEPVRATGAIDSKDLKQVLGPRPPAAPRTSELAPAEPGAFDRAPEAPAPPPPPRAEARSRLPSCEAALEAAHQDVDFSQGNGTADLPTAAIAAVLENGAWLSSCGVPPNTSLEVCVAIRGGNVIGASVTSRPPSSDVTACVRRRASSLQFPYSSHVDIARTRF